MFSFFNHKIFIMGVTNVTPNSFSDGGNYLTNELPVCDILDIGAESTAPMNSAITYSEEQKRLENFFHLKKEELKKFPVISIDTYKKEIIDWSISTLKELGFLGKIIWNDVSGVIDFAVIDFLEKNPNFSYVYTSSFVDQRINTNSHSKFQSVGADFEKKFLSKFENDLEKLKKFQTQIFLDPGFGFSKSKDQNYQLLKFLPGLMTKYAQWKWLIGISRKSFLRTSETVNVKDPIVQNILDKQGIKLISSLLKEVTLPAEITLRVHNVAHVNLLTTDLTLRV